MLTDLEHELERGSRGRQLRVVLAAWWRRAARWVLLGAATLIAAALCVLAGVACVPNAAAAVIGVVSLGLGLLWGLAICRRPAG